MTKDRVFYLINKILTLKQIHLNQLNKKQYYFVYFISRILYPFIFSFIFYFLLNIFNLCINSNSKSGIDICFSFALNIVFIGFILFLYIPFIEFIKKYFKILSNKFVNTLLFVILVSFIILSVIYNIHLENLLIFKELDNTALRELEDRLQIEENNNKKYFSNFGKILLKKINFLLLPIKEQEKKLENKEKELEGKKEELVRKEETKGQLSINNSSKSKNINSDNCINITETNNEIDELNKQIKDIEFELKCIKDKQNNKKLLFYHNNYSLCIIDIYSILNDIALVDEDIGKFKINNSLINNLFNINESFCYNEAKKKYQNIFIDYIPFSYRILSFFCIKNRKDLLNVLISFILEIIIALIILLSLPISFLIIKEIKIFSPFIFIEKYFKSISNNNNKLYYLYNCLFYIFCHIIISPLLTLNFLLRQLLNNIFPILF